MSDVVNQAAEYLGPTIPEVVALTGGAASAAIALPAAPGATGRFVTFVFQEAVVYVKFGDSTVAAPDETATSGTGRCMSYAAGLERSVWLPTYITHIRVKSGTSGNFRYYVSQP